MLSATTTLTCGPLLRLAAAVAALLFALGTAPELVAQPDPERLGRQIRIMEKVIDQVLVDSQHALVSGRPNCRGVRLQGYGVLFVIELSPIGSESLFHFNFKDDGSYELNFEDEEEEEEKERQRLEGRRRTVGRRDAGEGQGSSDDIEYEDEETPEKVKAKEQKALKEKRKLEEWVKELEKQAERGANPREDPAREVALARVREELVDILRDYGHTITGIGADEYVAIAVFPSDLDWRGPDTRTLLQVKYRAIDAFNESKVSAEEFAKLVEVVTQ